MEPAGVPEPEPELAPELAGGLAFPPQAARDRAIHAARTAVRSFFMFVSSIFSLMDVFSIGPEDRVLPRDGGNYWTP